MNNTTILKLLELLEQDNKQAIKEILTSEMLNNTDKKAQKIYNIVKKYLSQKDIIGMLKKINHKIGKQFICDGHTLHIFNNYKNELDTLPQATEEESLNYPKIYNSNNYEFHEQTEEDKFLIENIKKYINFVKSQPNHNKKDTISVYYHELEFNAEYLSTSLDLHQKDIETMQIAYNSNTLVFKGNDVDSLILPLRTDNERLEKAKQVMQDFKNKLKGEI